MTRDQLEYIGWGIDPDLIEDGVINHGRIDVTGYNEGDYWEDGKFLGPDIFGVTPIYLDGEGNQFPQNAERMSFIG